MKFPIKKPENCYFTYMRYMTPDKKGYYDDGICRGCGKKEIRTYSEQGLANLCKECYEGLYIYSKSRKPGSSMDRDPYGMKYMKSHEVSDELLRKAIKYGKMVNEGVIAAANVSTAAIADKTIKAYAGENNNRPMTKSEKSLFALLLRIVFKFIKWILIIWAVLYGIVILIAIIGHLNPELIENFLIQYENIIMDWGEKILSAIS